VQGFGLIRIPDAATVAHARRVGVGLAETPTHIESELSKSAPPVVSQALVPPVHTCPHCSYAIRGNCVVCAAGDPHPACEYCEGGKHKPPWYRREIAIAVFSAVAVTTLSTIVLAQVRKRTKLRI